MQLPNAVMQLPKLQKLDTRGGVLAKKLRNNACKLAKWTVQSLLAGSDQIKFGYVSRTHIRDSSRHVILGTQQFKPQEFATQISLSMDNAWGILRCIVDICMKQKDGKYLIMSNIERGPDHNLQAARAAVAKNSKYWPITSTSTIIYNLRQVSRAV